MGEFWGTQKCLHRSRGICAGENAKSALPAAKMTPLTMRCTTCWRRALRLDSSRSIRSKHQSRKFESERCSRLAHCFNSASLRSLMAIEVFFFLSRIMVKKFYTISAAAVNNVYVAICKLFAECENQSTTDDQRTLRDSWRLMRLTCVKQTNGWNSRLSVCHSIIAVHRGKLWATNNVDRGATFHFSLPIDGDQR